VPLVLARVPCLAQNQLCLILGRVPCFI
jgi:hypothetical protein